MKNQIESYINDPVQLEKLYRYNKVQFKQSFATLYPELKGSTSAEFWNERLKSKSDELYWGSYKDLLFVIIASLMAGLIAKLPAILSISEEYFYPRNIGFIIFPALSAFFIWKNKLSKGQTYFIASIFLLSIIFINYLPEGDTLILSCIHLILFLWAILGYAFVGKKRFEVEARLSYLRYNGELVVMTTLILLAGAIMTAATFGLFSLIELNIEEFFEKYIIIFGLPAAPILGTYLINTNPQLVGKVSPVIAKIFSPLVLVMLVIYLVAILYSGKDPYNDREFLLIFNGLLIGVIAIIFFSIAEKTNTKKHHLEIWILFLLSITTILVNGIALSAIMFRISEWGITPNRAAVLGSNVLILINLVLVTLQLNRVLFKKTDINVVGNSIANYLPIYCIWAIIVAFLFPFLFGFT